MGPRRSGLIFSATVLLALIPHLHAAAAEEYFVSPNGNDLAPGSESAPWAGFQHALSQLEPGDVLTARGGTYEQEVRSPTLSSGTRASPITVRAYPGERPVIKGLFWIRDPDYWRFDGINVTWGNGDPDEHMVKLTGGTGWEYVNSEIWGAQSYAGVLVASGEGTEPTNWRIAGNCIHDTGESNDRNQDHLIYANSGHEGRGAIEGNVMFNAPNGEGVKLGGSSSSSGGASNVIVRHNTIVDTAQSILIAWSSSNNLIEGNMLVGVEGNYSNIRAYQLRAPDNRAVGNLGADSKGLIWNDDDTTAPIEDAGGNLHGVRPEFASEGCDGFEPTNPVAEGYGHTAAGSTGGSDAGSSSADEETDSRSGYSGVGSESGNASPSSSTGAFVDDDHSIFEADIDRLAEAGTTAGCNPPKNDRFCPDRPVTRAQMAAFLVRALGLTMGGQDQFGDDDGRIFEPDIDRLAGAGITTGCNPPTNDRFCPDRAVSRAQMATFLTRAQELSGGTVQFDDVSGSVHAADIHALASAGITKGCNPPENDRFCPDRAVTRGEMAAFLVRTFNP